MSVLSKTVQLPEDGVTLSVFTVPSERPGKQKVSFAVFVFNFSFIFHLRELFSYLHSNKTKNLSSKTFYYLGIIST